MTIRHHPSDATLTAFAAGTLDDARQAAVATHMAGCRHCRQWVRSMEAVGGALLDDLPATALAPRAFADVLARLDEPAPSAVEDTESETDDVPGLPPALRRYRFGRWRWIGPGVQMRSIEVPQSSSSRLFLLKARPGTKLPDHTHTGLEMTCVLTGSFHDGRDRFGAGDFDETDDAVDHRPVVDQNGPCICLVAMQGQLRLNGLVGRLMQPFVRM